MAQAKRGRRSATRLTQRPKKDSFRMQVYLDNSATTRVDDTVVAAMLPYFTEAFGNASSTHQWGQHAKQAIETARSQVAQLINAQPAEITFLSGGTEADNLAIKGIAEAHQAKGRHVITSQFEHSAVLASCAELEKRGWQIRACRFMTTVSYA